jgi:tetratricopeptide (TPR) repeat protein
MATGLKLRKAARIGLVGLLLGVLGLGVWAVAWNVLAESHLRRAEKALQKQRYPQALEEYRRALRYHPQSARLHLLAGRTARRAGDFQAAREHLRQCRELQDGVSEEQQLEEYLLRAQTGEVDEVHRYLVPYLLQEGQLTPLVLEALVRGYMGKYRMQLAWQCLHRWLELEPDNVEALFRRATWYAQQQSIPLAVDDFHRVLDLDPERLEARLAVAELLHADKNFAEEIEVQYREVLRRSPQDATALLGLAQCCVEAGRSEEARGLLDALPEDKRATATELWLRGMLEMHDGRLDNAEGLLRQAMTREPRILDACYNLMLCLRRLGRDEDARAMSERFQQIERDEKRLIAITTKEMGASPLNPALHCELGEIYLRLAVPERALHWFNSALRIDPNYRRAHECLRDYYHSRWPEDKEKADYHRRQLATSG